MRNEQLYIKTVDILVQAYFNDTLQHSNCYACAVGNIVAGNMGVGFFMGNNGQLIWNGKSPIYYDTDQNKDYRSTLTTCVSYPRNNNLSNYQQEQLSATGYSFNDLTKIEEAFEGADEGDDWMFNGLMAVIDVLDEIHENKDESITESSKKKFNRNIFCKRV